MLFTTLFVSLASAHGTHAGETVALHEGYDHSQCYIDLHAELTPTQMTDFSREFADAGAVPAMASAETLDKGEVLVGLTYQKALILDTTPQWNNTFSHPGEEHWLGEPGIPMLQGRIGLGSATEVEAMGTIAPGSNWGLAAVGAKHTIIEQSSTMPLSFAARTATEVLVGAPDVDHGNLSLEGIASRRFGVLSPFVGVGGTASLTMEETDELDLGSTFALGARGIGGLELRWKGFHASAQGTLASVPSYGIQLGAVL